MLSHTTKKGYDPVQASLCNFSGGHTFIFKGNSTCSLRNISLVFLERKNWVKRTAKTKISIFKVCRCVDGFGKALGPCSVLF